MNKKVINIISVASVACLLLTGCTTTQTENNDPLKKNIPTGFQHIETIEFGTLLEIRNQETGAHYYMTDSYYDYYSLTPVINSKGKFKVTQKTEIYEPTDGLVEIDTEGGEVIE